MIDAAVFIERLRAAGYTHFTGVPCSFLTPFINYVIDDEQLDYVGAASEGEAVAISLGAYLAGRKTVTMCQNSGLGNMVNPLTSLNYPFRIPTLLISTWRGQPGVPDEPQHEQMGRIMHRLLETLEIPWRPFPRTDAKVEETIVLADRVMRETERPFALVMEKGTVRPHTLRGRSRPDPLAAPTAGEFRRSAAERMTRTGALEMLLSHLRGDEAVIATTGKTGRELFTIADRPNHVYVVGGMGTASAIGFGVAQALPDQPVVVVDGDGAALMKLGSMATIGYYRPRNLLHIVLDNEAHDSTGGQATSSSVVSFAQVAAATGYRNAYSVDHPADFADAVRTSRLLHGPTLLHVKIRPGSPKELGRPTVKPHEVRDRFMGFLTQMAPAAS